MTTCLMKTRGSTLSPLRISRQHIDAEPAPEHRIEFDRHRDVAVLHGAQRRRHAVHAGDDGLAGRVGRQHRLHGAEREIVVGRVDGLEIGIGDQRILGVLQAAFARQRTVGLEHDLDVRIFRHHLVIALGEIAEGRRAARANDHRDLAFAVELLGRPFRDVAADLHFVHRHMDGLVRRCRTARQRHDRDFGRRRRIVGGIDADRIDRRNQNAFDALGDKILHAIDLLQLIFVGGHGRDIPAEFAGRAPGCPSTCRYKTGCRPAAARHRS